MLTTLIYRSQLNLSHPSTELREVVERARRRNAKLNITGVLLSKGDDVLQILEGSEEGVVRLFNKIRDDKRHSGVVELMRDYGPRRRFENVGMLLFDLQTQSPKEVLQSVLRYSKLDSYLASDDRVFKFIQTFITQTFITDKRPNLFRRLLQISVRTRRVDVTIRQSGRSNPKPYPLASLWA